MLPYFLELAPARLLKISAKRAFRALGVYSEGGA